MRSLSLLACAALALLTSTVTGCAAEPQDDDTEGGESAFTGTPNDDVGQLFMIEHFGVVADGYADVHAMIKKKNLGALILWNPQQASGETARAMVTGYARSAHESGRDELFVAADQEERGTQRFKSRHGFTDLVDGATLGRIVARDGNARVCELHARITSREMASAGLNMALGTVSDVYTRNSGTPGMFRTRAIGSDANVIASCITAMTKAYKEEGHVVFITKHFPGLGNASGNTDVDASVHTYSTTKEKMENELLPYRHATAAVNGDGSWPLFGAMISHASYEILDASKTPATLSPAILEGLMRGAPNREIEAGRDASGQTASFAGMGLRGLSVSDAFWTWGAARELPAADRRRLMARSVLAGMDVLMIAKADFNAAWDYFQSLHAGDVPPAEQAALVRDAGAADWASLHAKFRARVQESAARVRAAKSRAGDAASFVGRGAPNATTTELADEYRRLTR